MKLSYTDLISVELSVHAKKVKENDSEIISYFLNSSNGVNTLDSYQNNIIYNDYYRINTKSHSINSKAFINYIFKELDPLIDIDFQEMNHNNGSLIDIYCVDYSSSFVSNIPGQQVVGQVIPQTSTAGSWWDILWKKTNSSLDLVSTEKNTIIHEIGHALGLSHPKEDPFNKNWDTKDTVMSYNESTEGWDFWFSQKDILALQSIWGRENDDKSLSFHGQSNDYKFFRNSDKTLGIESEIGKETLNDIETLIFLDKHINIQNDIQATFDQVLDIDEVTGKIFRLYNAALDRFPDPDGLNYWITKNSNGENTYRQTCASFIISEEFENKYGNLNKNKDYLTTLYSNIFNREPDNNGFTYWLGQLDNKIEDRSEVLMGFSESVENKALFMETTGLVYG